MTDSFLDYAEEQFLANDFVAAYKTAKTAQLLDPFFGGIDRYVAAYRVHAASLCKHDDGEINWYNILEIDSLSSTEVITHRFCRMGKLINPDDHCSAAAKGATISHRKPTKCWLIQRLELSFTNDGVFHRFRHILPPSKAYQRERRLLSSEEEATVPLLISSSVMAIPLV